ncbi:hypothetical protein PILCRDRAFT_812892 [Piloderma croceum F 1598]|uniref:Uncharacterized protein n=1 Tax=Piloderma croceum (strain F 1598) TaxID=765440 RepID=A0A0C3CGX2_PILCF|nr:hypothetical protein PILCRDRAFT_812892 [Piloderma croceum F 1598]
MSVGIVPDEGKVAKGNKQETGEDQLEDLQILPNAWTTTRRCRKDRWFDTLDLEARKAYGRALMSGQDPFQIDDVHLCSEKSAVEAWQREIGPNG